MLICRTAGTWIPDLIPFAMDYDSHKNGKLVRKSEFDFLTSAQRIPSDDEYSRKIKEWSVVRNKDDTIPKEGERDYVRVYKGNSGTLKNMEFAASRLR